MIRHITRATRHLVFWSLIALAIGMTGIRLALTGAENYKAKLAERIGELLETPVAIGRLRATMRGFSPELVLSDIAIASAVPDDRNNISLRQIRVGIHLLDALVSRDLLSSSWLTLVGAKLSIIRKIDGSIAVAGLKAGDDQPLWLLQGGRYEVLDSVITWQDERQKWRSMTFDSVDLALINDGGRHRINALLQLPEQYGDRLNVSLDFSGNLFESAAIDGKAFMDGRHVQLPAWLAMELPMEVGVKSGAADFQAWGEWRRSELVSLIASTQAEKLSLYRKDIGTFTADRLKSRFVLRHEDNGWRFDVKEFLLSTPKGDGKGLKDWRDVVFSVSGVKNADGAPLAYAGYIERLDLQETALIAQYFLPVKDGQGQWLRQSGLKGNLVEVSWFAEPEQNKLAINGNFADLGFAPLASFPGIIGASGHIRGDEQKGVLRLDSRDAELHGDLFRQPLAVDRLTANLGWRQETDHWSIASPSIELDSLSLKSKSRLRLQLAKNGGQNFVDLQSAFTVDDASHAKRYWPVKIMDVETVDWLDRAFVKGRVTNGGFLLYGNPDDFPFKDGSGVFEVDFDVTGMEMVYDPSWPHFVDVDAEALFYGERMTVSVGKGRSRNVTIKQAEVAIPNLSEKATLLVKGEAESSIAEALAFLRQTPLHAPVDKVMDVISPDGNTQVKLDLEIPLTTDDAVRVDGSAQLNNAKMRVKSLNLAVSEVKGQIRFDASGIYSDSIGARALGHPIEVGIDNVGLDTEINVLGKAEVAQLQEHFNMPWWRLVEGSTDYRLQLLLPGDDSAPELTVLSELQGLEVNLPSFLKKSREQRKKLSLVFRIEDQPLLPITLNYDNKLKAALKLNIAEQTLYSGRFLLGDGAVLQRREPGLELAVKASELDLRDWLGFSLGDDAMAGGNHGLETVEMHLSEAFWNETRLGKLDLTMHKEGADWQGSIGGQLAKGRILWAASAQEAVGRIRLDFDRLELSALKRFASNERQPDTFLAPNSVPLIAVNSKETYWQSVLLGELNLETEREPVGIAVKRLDVIGKEQKLTMTGDWKVTGKESLTQMQGRLELIKGSNLFAKLEVAKNLVETDGTFDFALNWQAAPHQFSTEALRGQFDVDLKSGRILSIEPGFGRILGILAMKQWIKRLQLDFSDVYQEGLTFNSIKGNFVLNNGKAVTNNLVVDAVPAKIVLSGETDLVRRTVDQIVDVTPKSADALPIAGTIMGKVASLVAKSLTGAEQEGFFFGSQYRLTGKWGDVQIASLHENDGLLQKTWNGITDFSWFEQQKKK